LLPIRNAGLLFPRLAFVFCSVLLFNTALAQRPTDGAPVTLQNAPQRDTSDKKNSSQWKNERARVFYKKLGSEKQHLPDTTIHTFHRRFYTQPWYVDLGNSGTAVKSLFFTPEPRTGPSLGYHVMDVYRFNPDSLNYYNTTRPYSRFTFQLGSKAEQLADILHSQNISPRWNIAAQYRKVTSPGYYKIQRVNHDLGSLTTNYAGRDQHYKLNAAFVYNKLQQDENGGIPADSFLTDSDFDDRGTIPVRFANDAFSIRRSSVTNNFRDVSFLLVHSYTIGRTDTTYNEDSTSYEAKLIPRFRISHRLRIGSEKHEYKDLAPDSARYLGTIDDDFRNIDSIYSRQEWFYTDNTLMLGGFIGRDEKQLAFTAGFGNRIDNFKTRHGGGGTFNNILSNYLEGELKKEALEPEQWHYGANAKFFLTGDAAGNFIVNATIGKQISKRIGTLEAGFQQQLNNTPYNYTVYQNQYYRATFDFGKESITQLYGTLENEPLGLGLGFRNYFIGNYIYVNEQQSPDQQTEPLNITQIWLNKAFKFGVFVLDNQVAWQQKAGDAPVNIPAFMGRHQLSIETWLFSKALKVATGIDVRYHTPYKPSGYSPILNHFYYQDSYEASNLPVAGAFFNFQIKNFRAYIMGDQLQQFFGKPVVNTPGYPSQDAMLRFGFCWIMIN
jgi:hypothetical protein